MSVQFESLAQYLTGSANLPRPSIPVSQPEWLDQLRGIREDPQIKKLARARAADPYLAEEALQEAYYAMARLKDPQLIEDVWALFCRVLLRKMNYLRGQLGAVPVDNAAELVDAFGRKLGGEALPVRFDVAVNTKLVAHEWLRRFASQRVALIRQVPGRSREPDRYRDLIFTAAEGVLAAIVAGDFREADLNLALHAAYQEWFGEDGVAVRNIHQRFARARADVCALLRNIISVEEVYA